MFHVVLVLGLFVAAQGLGRIVGGKDAKIEDYKHQVSLRLYNEHRCGGSLVTRSAVITAAHCTYTYSGYLEYFSVQAGSNDQVSGGEVRGVQAIYQHGKYAKPRLDYDVSIVILKASFDLSDAIGLIQLAKRNDVIKAGTPSWVTGWGATRQGGPVNRILQVVEVPNIDRDVCVDLYQRYNVTKRMSCWGYPQGEKDACQGDSGGPLVIDGENGGHVLAGIVSWGIGCAKPNQPGVYADITNEEIHDFITQLILV